MNVVSFLSFLRLQSVLQVVCLCLSQDTRVQMVSECVSVLTAMSDHPSLAKQLCSQHGETLTKWLKWLLMQFWWDILTQYLTLLCTYFAFIKFHPCYKRSLISLFLSPVLLQIPVFSLSCSIWSGPDQTPEQPVQTWLCWTCRWHK